MEHLEQTRFPPQNTPAHHETTATNDDPTTDHLQQQQLQQQDQEPRVTDERANEDTNATSNDDETAMTRMMTMKQGHGDEDADARWEERKFQFMSKVAKEKKKATAISF